MPGSASGLYMPWFKAKWNKLTILIFKFTGDWTDVNTTQHVNFQVYRGVADYELCLQTRLIKAVQSPVDLKINKKW
jgi:hypothetical protein